MHASTIWTKADTLMPFDCSQCHREFPQGGPRWHGTRMGMNGQQEPHSDQLRRLKARFYHSKVRYLMVSEYPYHRLEILAK